MTGHDAVRQALSLLNYTEADGRPGGVGDDDLRRRSLALVNQIYADLWYTAHTDGFVPLRSLNETVCLSPAAERNALPYGVAMLLAQTEGDTDNQSVFASLYNQRRGAGMLTGECMRDCLPTAET